MSQYDIRTVLDDIASKEISDDMNLWNDIHAKVQRIPATRARPILGLSRAAAAVVAIFLVGTAYAVYQAVTRSGDPGIQAVADLVTDLNLMQSAPNDDVNVTLDWAYADGHRIAFQWTLDHPIALNVPAPDVRLYDADGNAIDYADFLHAGGGGGGGGGDRISYAMTASFDARWVQDAPDTLSLTAEFAFVPPPEETSGLYGAMVAGGEGGGGGGGGGGEGGEPMPPRTPLSEAFTLTFPFEVPFIPAIRLDGEFTAEANGITMALHDVSYAPSITIATLCYTGMEADPLRMAYFVQPSERAYQTSFHSEQTGPDADGTICGEVTSFQLADPEAGTVDLSVARLATPVMSYTEEMIEQLQAAIDADGLPITVSRMQSRGDPETYYLIAELTDAIEQTGDPEHQYYLLDVLNTRLFGDPIEGPWTFVIDVN